MLYVFINNFNRLYRSDTFRGFTNLMLVGLFDDCLHCLDSLSIQATGYPLFIHYTFSLLYVHILIVNLWSVAAFYNSIQVVCCTNQLNMTESLRSVAKSGLYSTQCKLRSGFIGSARLTLHRLWRSLRSSTEHDWRNPRNLQTY